jgi:hypothetical protein
MTQQLTLVSLLTSKIIENNEDLNKVLTFPVDKKVLNITKKILEKSPDSLNKVTSIINDILSDNVIDHKDIPKLMRLTTQLFNSDMKVILTDISFTSEDIVKFIQFLIKLTIEFELIKIKENDKTYIYDMIELSGDLLLIVLPTNNIEIKKITSKCKESCSC